MGCLARTLSSVGPWSFTPRWTILAREVTNSANPPEMRELVLLVVSSASPSRRRKIDVFLMSSQSNIFDIWNKMSKHYFSPKYKEFWSFQTVKVPINICWLRYSQDVDTETLYVTPTL